VSISISISMFMNEDYVGDDTDVLRTMQEVRSWTQKPGKTPLLLEEDIVFAALKSCNAYTGITQHQQFSFDRLVTTDLPRILCESREIVAETATSIHVVQYKHVHVDRPVAKSDGGFFNWIRDDVAKITRHTLANPITVDVEYIMSSNADTSREVLWETIDPSSVDREIQILERRRKGQDWSDLVVKTTATVPTKGRRRVTGSGVVGAVGAVNAPGGSENKTAGSSLPNKSKAGAGAGAGVGGGAGAAPPPAPPARPWTVRERRTYRQIVQFQLPTMVKGRADGEQASLHPNARYDPGGYFIVKGSERVVIPQKHLQINKCFVFAAPKGPWPWTAEVRACSAKLRSTSTLRVNLRCGPRGSGPLKATVQMPYIGSPSSMHIPLIAVCMLLGFKSAEHVATAVATGGVTSGLVDIPPGSLWDTHDVKTTRLWVLSLLRDDAHTNLPFETMSPEKIMQWIGEMGTARKNAKERCLYVKHLLANEFLPQIGLTYNEKTLARKAQYFAFMLWRLAQVARGIQEPDDRDHAGNKQYDLCGMLIGLLVRQQFRAFRKRVMSDIRRCAEQGRLVAVPELLSFKRLTDALTYALSTGNWGMKKGASSQTGVAQILQRLNLVATVSHLRRLNTPLKREGKQARPRHIHTSLWGLECPAETPEGPPCGLVGQMAQCVVFCHGHPASRIVRQAASILGEALFPLLQDEDLLTGSSALLPSRPSHLAPKAVIDEYAGAATSLSALDLQGEGWARVREQQTRADRRMYREAPDLVRVIVNGILLGFVADGPAAAKALRLGRRARRLPFDVAVELFEGQGVLAVSGEAGGRRRALFVLDRKKQLGAVVRAWEAHRRAPPEAFWRALLLEGAVEYVSKYEEENLMVLQSPTGGYQLHEPMEEYTHCEIHPSTILGLAAAMIPFSDHNQAPRTTYFAAMSKQIAGNPGPETPYTNALRLMYPQESLVTTWAQVIHGTTALSSSQNVWVAVLADGGQNQEDSLYLNGDSAARGLFACLMIRNHTEDCQGGTAADSQRFEKPAAHVFGRKTGSYDKLGPDGIAPPGTYIQGGDVVIGKTMFANEIMCPRRSVVSRDQSYQLHPREKAMGIDSVKRCRGRDDKDLVMVQMHNTRFLQVGDKLTSAHGQKGVVGCIKPAKDMPWTEGGLVADMMINPHAMPSRMTIGQPIEAATGLLCARHGVIGDGTPFRKPGETTDELITALNRDLLANGFECMGDHVMYKGETGQRIRARIFFGPVAYFRVKQMVDDKHHARARGPVHMTTQQPTEGRSKDGGLRIGEMERDCIQSHGAANVCTDRLFYSADYAEVPICKTCHLLAMPRAPQDRKDLVVGVNEHAGYCLNCKRAGTVFMTPLPYITKLLSLELMAMHIRPEIQIETNPRVDTILAASVGVGAGAGGGKRRRVTWADDAPPTLHPEDVLEAPSGFGLAPQLTHGDGDGAGDGDDVSETAPEGFGTYQPSPGPSDSRKRARTK
jgi:DNA-directed RNA polymerase II subunit RPB2